MRPSQATKSAQVPLLGAAAGASSLHPQSRTGCVTRRTKSLVQLAIAATLVTASITLLRQSDRHSPAAPPSWFPGHVASVLRLSAPVHLPPAPTQLAIAPHRAAARVEDHDGALADEPRLDAFSGDGLLRKLTTVLKPLARTKVVSYDEPWVYARDPSELPPCERILLFQFMPWWGFASEYILYVRSSPSLPVTLVQGADTLSRQARAAAAADKLGYTFLEDDRNWCARLGSSCLVSASC